nr:hypothetical protein [Paludibacter sp.]
TCNRASMGGRNGGTDIEQWVDEPDWNSYMERRDYHTRCRGDWISISTYVITGTVTWSGGTTTQGAGGTGSALAPTSYFADYNTLVAGLYGITGNIATSGSWTVSDGVTRISVVAVGGGGNGTGNNGTSYGGAGGGAGYVKTATVYVTAGQQFTWRVGLAGGQTCLDGVICANGGQNASGGAGGSGGGGMGKTLSTGPGTGGTNGTNGGDGFTVGNGGIGQGVYTTDVSLPLYVKLLTNGSFQTLAFTSGNSGSVGGCGSAVSRGGNGGGGGGGHQCGATGGTGGAGALLIWTE